MRLRAIELHGYKSFAARTALQFDAPMTAIVGPNGSGKSNVMDGLRWAIGAGAGRALRAKRAEDVIFSGGRDRAPSGFAEVRVQLDNGERWLDLDAAEVEIVRRVHRDGQSELRVNGRAVRLRDVQDLFRNSGLGAGGFALMSQGLVDEMLRLRPFERRQAIEEAGGVRQHRHQMEESRRRRERAEEHLARARLLRDELSPRLKSLERAARRARRVEKVRVELDAAMRDYFSAAAAELERELLTRRQAAAAADAAREAAERRREAATAALAAAEREASESRQAVEAAAERIRSARSELRTLEHEQELDQQQRSWLSREISALSARLASHSDEQQTIDAAAAGRALADANAALTAARAARDRRERDYGDASSRQRGARAEIDEIASQASRLARRWRANAAQRLQAVSDDAAAAVEAQAAAESLDEAERTREASRQSLLSAEEAARREQRQREALTQRIDEIASQLGALQQRSADAGTLRARVYELTDDHARADAIFGELMDATLHDSFEDALDAVRGIVEADAGRAIALSNADVDRVIRSLLGGVAYVDDEAAAVESAARGRAGVNAAATPSGIVVRADGVVQGGGSMPGAARRRRQSAELRSEREELAAQRASLRPDDEHAGRIAAAERRVEQAAERHDAAAQAASAATRRLDALRRRRAGSIEDRARFGKDVDLLRGRLRQACASESDAAASLDALNARDAPDTAALERRRDECAAELAEARAQTAAADSARADRARLASLRREREQVESAIREREPMLERSASVASDTASLDRAREQLELLEASRREASEALELAQQSRLAAEREAVETSAALRETESARARLSAEAAAEGIALHAASVSERVPDPSQAGFDLNSLNGSDRAANGFGDEPRGAAAAGYDDGHHSGHDRSGVTRPASEPSRAVAIAEPRPRSVDELRELMLALRTRLQRLGPVDPGAASEYDAERRRWEHMEVQIEDLEQTERSLREAERDLERQIERQFRAACRQVDQAFQHYFQLMFRGGHAELVLTEDESAPEDGGADDPAPPRVGVDIRAQPPGKRVSSLGLLSGGERALTAIALLFALLEVRPAPFCVLDEVDAALDEANVERFVNALRERAPQTQFIVITHNRRTIEQADSIYGVTMGAAGVSRLLSVRVDQLAQADLQPAVS